MATGGLPEKLPKTFRQDPHPIWRQLFRTFYFLSLIHYHAFSSTVLVITFLPQVAISFEALCLVSPRLVSVLLFCCLRVCLKKCHAKFSVRRWRRSWFSCGVSMWRRRAGRWWRGAWRRRKWRRRSQRIRASWGTRNPYIQRVSSTQKSTTSKQRQRNTTRGFGGWRPLVVLSETPQKTVPVLSSSCKRQDLGTNHSVLWIK